MLKQAVRSWVASPFGVNLLLASFKDSKGNENFTQIHHQLKGKPECKVLSKIFTTPSSNHIELLKDIDNKLVCKSEHPQDTALLWAKENTLFKKFNLRKEIFATALLLLLNNCTFKSSWKTSASSRCAKMTIYNSFNYTQDVKYEARMLEFPMKNEDFKLVVIAPNETDLLHTLFRRLGNEGFSAAINSIQPLFVVSSELQAPSIQFQSENVFQQNINESCLATITQCGYINVNEEGTEIQVLSCLSPTSDAFIPGFTDQMTDPPFFFGLLFREIPIFTGQYNHKLYNY